MKTFKSKRVKIKKNCGEKLFSQISTATKNIMHNMNQNVATIKKSGITSSKIAINPNNKNIKRIKIYTNGN